MKRIITVDALLGHAVPVMKSEFKIFLDLLQTEQDDLDSTEAAITSDSDEVHSMALAFDTYAKTTVDFEDVQSVMMYAKPNIYYVTLLPDTAGVNAFKCRYDNDLLEEFAAYKNYSLNFFNTGNN